jgi:hypothetical protein
MGLSPSPNAPPAMSSMRRLPDPVRCLLAAGLILLFLAAGCSKSASDEVRPLPERETWDVWRMQDAQVGHAQTTIRHIAKDGRDLVKVDQSVDVAVQRFGQKTEQKIHISNTETPDGRLLDFQTEIQQGPTPVRTVGRVRGDKLEIEITTQGKKTTNSVPCPLDCGGPLAPEESLLRIPMKPGERSTIRYYDGITGVVSMELTAAKYEKTPLLKDSSELLRIDSVLRMADGQEIKAAAWMDREGNTLKTRIESMNLETFRVPKEVALGKLEPIQLDLGTAPLVKVDRAIPGAHRAERIRYRVRLDDGDPSRVFLSGPSQEVKRIDDHTAEVTVCAIRPGQKGGNANAAADPPTDADRRASNFVQSDAPAIVAQAGEAAGKETDPGRVAMALEQYANRAVTTKGYTQAFPTAADVAKTHEGDCKAHAVYLAALARARGIPARVAAGLVYIESQRAFGYHMWTEVYVDKRWIPLDGTLGKGGIGGGHLKLAETSAEGTAFYAKLLVVLKVMGHLKIEVLDIE